MREEFAKHGAVDEAERSVSLDSAPQKPLARLVLVWLLFCTSLPLVAVASFALSSWLSYLFGIWQAYLYAVLIPVAVLSCAYLMAPRWPRAVVLLCALIGLFLGIQFLFPVYYPDWHLRAYQESYQPFKLFFFTEVTIVLLALQHALSDSLHWLGDRLQQIKTRYTNRDKG